MREATSPNNFKISARKVLELGYWSFPGIWDFSMLQAHLRALTFACGRKSRQRVRLQDRGQRHFYPARRRFQLGEKKFALADANGTRLLRNRINGHRRVPVRHRAVRRRSDAVLRE